MDDIFCKIIKGEIPSFTVYENEYVKCIMDANPDASGHTLIIPKEHFTTILDMDELYVVEVHKAAKVLIDKMMSTLPNIVGVKSIINYGDLQFVKHFHNHLIPAYKDNADPNISQEEICNLLRVSE